MNLPADMTLRDWYIGCAVIGTLAGRDSWPRTDEAKAHAAAECVKTVDAVLAARGTPAPALDEAAIRKDERVRVASRMTELGWPAVAALIERKA